MERSSTKKMIARRIKKGGNPKEAEELLKKLQSQFTGDNLHYALVYNSFLAA